MGGERHARAEQAGGVSRLPLHSLELRHLLALRAVAERGSFAAAAASLGYVQSAVSGHIALLEQVLGHRLVERARGSRSTSLTAAGKVVLAGAEEVFSVLRRLDAELAALAHGPGYPVRVGAAPAIARGLLPKVLAGLPDGPDKLDLVEATDAQSLQDSVLAGEVDVCFVVGPVRPTLNSLEIGSDPFILLAAEGEEFGRLADLNDRTLYTLPPTEEQRELEHALRLKGFTPARVQRLEDPALVCSLASGGTGIALVERLASDGVPGARLLLDTLHPGQPIYAAWKGGPTASLCFEIAQGTRRALTDALDDRRSIAARPT
jgi:molybdate transport repressor ModE-like protein